MKGKENEMVEGSACLSFEEPTRSPIIRHVLNTTRNCFDHLLSTDFVTINRGSKLSLVIRNRQEVIDIKLEITDRMRELA